MLEETQERWHKASATGLEFKLGQFRKVPGSGVDFGFFQGQEAIEAEAFPRRSCPCTEP